MKNFRAEVGNLAEVFSPESGTPQEALSDWVQHTMPVAIVHKHVQIGNIVEAELDAEGVLYFIGEVAEEHLESYVGVQMDEEDSDSVVWVCLLEDK